MEGLKRQILYRKEANLPEPKKPKSSPIPKIHPKEALVTWLSAHPLINISGLAIACGIDRGNLTRWIKAGKIPDKHTGSLKDALKNYGYH